MTLGRFFRTPKGLAVLALGGLTIVAALGEGPRLILPSLAAGVTTAMLIDLVALHLQKKRWAFPSGALLTALIVVAILSPHEPWYVSAVTSAVAVVSKYVFRVKPANVFNPAALALVVTFYPFHAGHSWWGALPELGAWAIVILFASGIFIAYRVHKIPVVLAFLGVYFALFTIAAFVGNPAHVVALFREPDLHAALYFAFFMVTDPPTSPPKSRDQLMFGAIVAVTAFAAYELIGAAYFLLAGLLIGNVWEAWRRVRVRSHRALAV